MKLFGIRWDWRGNPVHGVVLLGGLTVFCMTLIQVYWFRQALADQQRQTQQQLFLALQQVAQRMGHYNQVTLPDRGLVQQLSGNYYAVNLNSQIDAQVLEHVLRSELEQRGLKLDFEYGIYDCGTNRMVYGNYVDMSGRIQAQKNTHLPLYDKYTYYFGIRFPRLTRYFVSQLEPWLYTSLLMVVIVGFFAYAILTVVKQRRLSEVQRDFINNMTHEFKTPISTLRIAAGVLAKPGIEAEPQRLHRYAQLVETESLRLATLVDKVLQLAKTDSTGLALEPVELSLPELAEATVKNFNFAERYPQGTLTVHTRAEKAQALADPVHLQQILLNLLDNAAKYSGPKPQVTLVLEVAGSEAHFGIYDQGPGIAKSHQKKIWQRFYRISTGNLHNVKGFGLGLYYVRKVCKASGWRIALESQPGQGTRVHIYLPLLKTETL